MVPDIKTYDCLNQSSPNFPGSRQMLGARDTFQGQEKASHPLCKKCQHLLAALQQVGGLQAHGKSCCLSSACFFELLELWVLGVAQNRQRATWEIMSALLGGFAAIMCQLGLQRSHRVRLLLSASVCCHDSTNVWISPLKATKTKQSWQCVTD